MQNNNDHMGGYVKYFTDMPATNGYPNTVIFPADDEMTVVCQGPFNGDGRPPADMWRGVKRMLTTPSYESAHFTQYYDPELAAKALAPFAKGTIGMVGIYQMSFAMGDFIMKKFPSAKYVDASELVDRVKVIKSAEELELVRRAAIMQDGAMQAAFAAIKPGMRDTEVAAVAVHYSQDHGSENGIYLCASTPLGTPAKFGQRHVQNRTIKKGDTLALLVEDSGPGAMFTELGRTCVLGKVPQAMKDELEIRQGVAQAHARPAQARHALQGYLGGVQRVHAQERPPRGGAALLPRPGLRSGRAAAHSQRRALDHPEGHEHRRASDLRARRLSQLAVRQLHHRRQRPRRPHPPVPGRDRRDRRLARAAIQSSPPGLDPGAPCFFANDGLPGQAQQSDAARG